MIIRRIVKNLAAQNWGAAIIELAIVVLGIFLGLQASSWFEERQERALESEILARLHTDFEEIRAEADSAINSHQRVIEGLVKLQTAIGKGSLPDEDRESVLFALRNVLNVDTGGGRSSTFTEIVASGRLSILTDSQLISMLAEYDERTTNTQPLFSEFRLMQMEYERDFNRNIRFSIPEQLDPRGFDAADVIDFDLEAMSQDRDFLQALVRMTTFQTYYQLWHWRTFSAASDVLSNLEQRREP